MVQQVYLSQEGGINKWPAFAIMLRTIGGMSLTARLLLGNLDCTGSLCSPEEEQLRKGTQH